MLYGISKGNLTELSLAQVGKPGWVGRQPSRGRSLHTCAVPSLPWNRPHNPLGSLILHRLACGPWERYTDFPTEVRAWGLHGLREGGEAASVGPLTGHRRLRGGLRGSALTGQRSLAPWNVTLSEKHKSKIPRRKKNTCISISVLLNHIYLSILIDVLLAYNVVLVSAIQRSESVTRHLFSAFFVLQVITKY